MQKFISLAFVEGPQITVPISSIAAIVKFETETKVYFVKDTVTSFENSSHHIIWQSITNDYGTLLKTLNEY